jgi:hypothetical protein
MKRIFIAMASLLCLTALHAQDKIYRQNGKVVEAKVLEIGSGEIKYRAFNNPDGPIYILETDRIRKIVYENGKEEKFEDSFKDPERYTGQLTKAIKVNFFSPLYGYTEIGYEKSMGVGRSLEFSLGLIGLGKSERIDWYYGQSQNIKRGQRGAFLSGGYKFGKMPSFILFGKTKMSHIMQGTYVKPILYLGHYKENQVIEKSGNTHELDKQNVTFGALQIEFGKQWVFADKVIMDLYWGLGYGVDNKEEIYQYYNGGYPNYYDGTSSFNYANARAGRSPGLSLSFGLKLGMLLK